MNKQVNKPVLSQQSSCHLLTITSWHAPISLYLPFVPEDPKHPANVWLSLAPAYGQNNSELTLSFKKLMLRVIQLSTGLQASHTAAAQWSQVVGERQAAMGTRSHPLPHHSGLKQGCTAEIHLPRETTSPTLGASRMEWKVFSQQAAQVYLWPESGKEEPSEELETNCEQMSGRITRNVWKAHQDRLMRQSKHRACSRNSCCPGGKGAGRRKKPVWDQQHQ